MPIPMTTCVICNETVTRRSTRCLEALGAGEGRACKSHPQVDTALRAFKEDFERQKLMTLASASIQFLSAAAAVRVYHTFFGTPLNLIYLRLSRKFTPLQLKEIEKEVERMGGPIMNSSDILNTFFGVAERLASKTP